MGNRIILSSLVPNPWWNLLDWIGGTEKMKWYSLGGRDLAVDLSSHFFIFWAETGHLQVFKRLGLSIRAWPWLLVHESSDAHHSCPRLSGKSWEAKYWILAKTASTGGVPQSMCLEDDGQGEQQVVGWTWAAEAPWPRCGSRWLLNTTSWWVGTWKILGQVSSSVTEFQSHNCLKFDPIASATRSVTMAIAPTFTQKLPSTVTTKVPRERMKYRTVTESAID